MQLEGKQAYYVWIEQKHFYSTSHLAQVALLEAGKAPNWWMMLIKYFFSSKCFSNLKVWVLLSTYLVEYIFIVIFIVLSINFIVFVRTFNQISADPVLASVYSLIFPLVPLDADSKEHLEDSR